MTTSKGIFVSEISAGLEKENGFSGQFVAILDTHLSTFDQSVLEAFADGAKSIVDSSQDAWPTRLRWELAHVAVFVEQIEDFALQTVGVGRQRWNR